MVLRPIPPAPADIHDIELFKRLRAASTPADGLAEKVEALVQTASPLLELIIAGPFHEYTLHNPGHSRKVLHLASSIISANTIQLLSALECAIIIYSAYIHDLGMALTSTERARLLASDDFASAVRGWPEIADALENARSAIPEAGPAHRAVLETQVFQMQEAVLSSYLRARHATPARYRELIQQLKASSGRPDLFSLLGVPFEQALIDVCESHNLDAGVLAESRGVYGDRFPRDLAVAGQTLNVQFCAAVLRLADILDFDRERTPTVLFDALAIPYRTVPGADVSLREWQKHMAVHTLSVSADEVVVSASCTHPAIESSVRHFCAGIERELRDTAAAVKNNRRDVFERYSLTVPVNVRAQIRSLGYVYKELAFRLNDSAIMSLLMGERLYSTRFAAVRELIQNADDACMARIHLGIDSGRAPQVSVRSSLQDGRRWLEVMDTGLGMDEHVLSEYFFRAGNCYYDSSEFRRLCRERSGRHYTPVSRFGIGLLSVFMIGDAIEVRTKHAGSPRCDSTFRTLFLEGRHSLAFVQEDRDGEPGTSIRVRLKDEASTRFPDWSAELVAYLRRSVVRPRTPLSIDLDGNVYRAEPGQFPTIQPGARREIEKRGLEVVFLELGRWSDSVTGIAALLFVRTPDGRLSHRTSEGMIPRFGFGPGLTVDPAIVFDRFAGNRVTVNGFLMSFRKKSTRLLRKDKRNSISFVYDVEVKGEKSVAYHVSRDRLFGDGVVVVGRALYAAIVKGLSELGILARMTPESLAIISPDPDLTPEILARVAELLPAGGYQRGLSRVLAEKLKISGDQAFRAVNYLSRGGPWAPLRPQGSEK